MIPMIKILEEMSRVQWAILPASLRAMLTVLDGEELDLEDYRFFHRLTEEQHSEISAYFGESSDSTLYTRINNNIGYLSINGPIIPRATAFSDVSGLVSIDRLASEFMALENNPRIKSIVHIIDSPGGAVAGISDYADLVSNSKKDTYAYTYMAASAAYWIASAVDTIISPTTGLVGSIGTVLSLTDYTEYNEKRGIKKIEIVSSQSPRKHANPNTDEGRETLQEMVDSLANVFIESVAKNRNTDTKTVTEKYGKGGLFVAHKAKEVGMIDSIENLQPFINGLNSKYNSFSFSTNIEKETKMSEEITIDGLYAAHGELIMQLVEDAKKEERKRLQDIESLKNNFEAALPAVKESVFITIDRLKYNADSTRDSIAAALLPVIIEAQNKTINDFAIERREGVGALVAAKVGKAIPTLTEDNDGSENESKERIRQLIAARDFMEKR